MDNTISYQYRRREVKIERGPVVQYTPASTSTTTTTTTRSSLFPLFPTDEAFYFPSLPMPSMLSTVSILPPLPPPPPPVERKVIIYRVEEPPKPKVIRKIWLSNFLQSHLRKTSALYSIFIIIDWQINKSYSWTKTRVPQTTLSNNNTNKTLKISNIMIRCIKTPWR